MQEFEFQIPRTAQLTNVDSAIESTCIAEGLGIGMKGSLTSFPGSTHWHFKKPGERGTLEITSFPSDRRIWAKVQSGRRADWIEPCLIKIKAKLEKALKKSTNESFYKVAQQNKKRA
jgi:hypothetical protein